MFWQALDYDPDISYFRFQDEKGQGYRIDVMLGTLDDVGAGATGSSTAGDWVTTTTTGIPMPRASIGKLLVLA